MAPPLRELMGTPLGLDISCDQGSVQQAPPKTMFPIPSITVETAAHQR
jgi:hypothetical protein